MPGLNNTTDQVKQFWTTRTGSQKALLVGGAAATVLLLTFFVRLIGTPDYKPLFTDLDPADAQTLSAQLDAQGIPHQTSADGKTISVPAAYRPPHKASHTVGTWDSSSSTKCRGAKQNSTRRSPTSERWKAS
jgi:hypothetical protein